RLVAAAVAVAAGPHAGRHSSRCGGSCARLQRCAYYGRVVRDGDYVVLQYWLFHVFNDRRSTFAGVNDHEADFDFTWRNDSPRTSGQLRVHLSLVLPSRSSETAAFRPVSPWPPH